MNSQIKINKGYYLLDPEEYVKWTKFFFVHDVP